METKRKTSHGRCSIPDGVSRPVIAKRSACCSSRKAAAQGRSNRLQLKETAAITQKTSKRHSPSQWQSEQEVRLAVTNLDIIDVGPYSESPRKSPRYSDTNVEKDFANMKLAEKASLPVTQHRKVMRSQSALGDFSQQRLKDGSPVTSRPKSGFAKSSRPKKDLSKSSTPKTREKKTIAEQSEAVKEEDVEEIKWAITELPEGTCLVAPDQQRQSFLSLAVTSGDDEDIPLLAVEDAEAQGSGDQLSESVIRRRQLKEAVMELIKKPSPGEEEYDTDLEEDFHPEPPKKVDIAGVSVYLDECKVEGVEPTRHIVKHLADTSFTMRHRYMGLRGILPLARALQKNAVIEVLDLSDNHLEGDAATAIAEMMFDNCYVTKLDLSYNQIKTPSMQIFAKMLAENCTLKSLSLRANHLTDKDAKLIAEGLANNITLTELDLSCNDFGELAGVYFGQGLLANDGLVYLDLRWNSIRGKGIVSIANSLKANSALEVLDLSWNGLTLPGCQALMRSLKVNQGLKVLNLCNNHINSEGARKIGIGMKKNSTLEVLLMNSNPIGNDGMLALIKSIGMGNTRLRLFGLQDIPIPEATYDKLQDLHTKLGMHILHLDIDGKKKFCPPSHIAVMVDQFINQNITRFLHFMLLREENHSGTLSAEQVMQALLDAGIEISKTHLQTALKDVGAQNKSNISFLPLLDGLASIQANQPKTQLLASGLRRAPKVESNKR